MIETAAKFPHRSLIYYAYAPMFQEINLIAITMDVLWDCGPLFFFLEVFSEVYVDFKNRLNL